MASGGSTRRARTPTSCCRRAFVSARNVEGYAFTGRARDGERLRVLSQVREAVTSVSSLDQAVMYRLDELPPSARALLHERHLVSKELAGLDTQHPLRSGAAVFLADGLGLMVNEEDHLRLQVPAIGLCAAGGVCGHR